MKKFLTIVLALALVMALAVPALAHKDEAVFDTALNLVDNEPDIGYGDWDVPYNIWKPLPANTTIHAGDTVTFNLTYKMPESVEGFDERMLASIEYLVTINGVDELKVVEAVGCPVKLECDYDEGVCMQVPGEYENVTLNGNTCTVMAQRNTTVSVVLRGIATSDLITATTDITIGQYKFPAYFSVGLVEKYEVNGYPAYNIHYTDTLAVQKQDLAFRANNSGVYTMYVALNNHYHRIDLSGAQAAYIPVDEDFNDSGAAIDASSSLYSTLTRFYDNFMTFFGIDPSLKGFGDESFIGDGEHQTFPYAFAFGESAVEPVDPTDEPTDPTDEPTDPTDEPTDPTDEPTDPTDPTDEPTEPTDPTDEPTDEPDAPDVPSTGAVSLIGIGLVTLAGGAYIVSRKRK